MPSKVVRFALGLFALAALGSSPASAAGFADYSLEGSAALGLNLPYDLWGTPGMLSGLAVRGAYKFNAKGRIEGGVLYQHAQPDVAYTGEVGFGYEMVAADLNTIFNIGVHYSYFDLEIDRDVDDACVPANCLTDSGAHVGIYVGAGLQIPLSDYTPLRLSMKFYQNPQIWLLLEAAVGFRF